MAQAANKDNTPDDIDLLNLIERSMRFFSRYKWVFLIAIILGLGAGYYFYKRIPTTYSSRMVVHSFLLTNPEEIQIVNTWNQLLGRGELETLSKRLNCGKDILRKVKRIKALEIQQVFNPTNPHGFTVDVIVTDNSVLDSLQSGLLYGFENSEYTKERLIAKRAGFRELIAKTESEIAKLDSTKQTVEQIIQGKRTGGSTLIIDVSTINRQLVELHEKLVYFRTELQFASAVQVLQSFNKYSQPSGPHLLPWFVIGLVISLVLAYIYALLHSIRVGLRSRARARTHQQPK